MDSSQVPWTRHVPYNDLVKQCPYLAQNSALTLVPQQADSLPDPPIISKSKKKRLKKRLKALCAASNLTGSAENNIPVHEIEKAIVNETVVRAKEVKLGENCPESTQFLQFHCQSSLKKIKAATSKAQPGPCKVSGLKDSVPLENINNTDIKSNIKAMPLPSKNTQKNKGANKSPSKRVPDVVDGETSSLRKCVVIPDKEKTEEKVNIIGVPIVKSLITDDNKSKNSERVTNFQSNSSIKAVNSNDSAKSKQPVVKVPDDAISAPLVANEKVPVPKQTTKPEKSREEVLAEREAKKKAKLASKLKKVDKSAEPLPTQEKAKEPATVNSDISKALENLNITSTPPSEQVAEGVKSKAELRAERRAKQEAQRAAKEADKKSKSDLKEINKENEIIPVKKKIPEKDKSETVSATIKLRSVSQQKIKLFGHLHVRSKSEQAQIIQNVHPSVVKLGVKYSSRIINGSNSRCVALLNCLKEVIQDYVTPAEKEFSRGLESNLVELTNYLNECRPMAVSMTNALRHIKSHLTQLPNNVSDDEAKRKLLEVIDIFIREQIDVAGEAICETVKNKIANDDVILIYSCSSLLYRILVESHKAGRKFSVVVVDGGPWFEGREMLRRLVDAGLDCTYVQVSAVSFIMRQATKVLLGAHALLANGCVMSRAGASLIALAAHSCNVPVLVCCETYKFCERVQTDAFVYNELGSPDDMFEGNNRKLSDWQSLSHLSPLSLLYDITPTDLVTAVVTELAILPCTSVPVILRIKPSDLIS